MKLAQLTARLRGIVSVYTYEFETERGEKKEVLHHSVPIIKNPDRCAQMLYNLARGHALIHERTQLSQDDIPLLIEVALSSAPIERTKILRYLIQKDETASAPQIKQDLNISKSTVHRIMRTLQILGLVNIETDITETEGGKQKIHYMTLRPEFQWLLKQETQSLLHGQPKQTTPKPTRFSFTTIPFSETMPYATSTANHPTWQHTAAHSHTQTEKPRKPDQSANNANAKW